jgi:transposase-like protein
MRKERKHYTAEEKVAVLLRHLFDKAAVSDLCEELGLQPTVFYRWQKEFFENGAAAFQTTERPRRHAEEKQKRIEISGLQRVPSYLRNDALCVPRRFTRSQTERSNAGTPADSKSITGTLGHADSIRLSGFCN